MEIEAKSILNKTKRRDPWFLDDYTVNPYSGCSFNCLYCYIRGSKYGLHMEEKLAVKVNSIALLRKALALRSRKKQFGIIVMSSATDPYLQLEKEYLLTRRLLEVILEYRFPVHIITKSDLVVRDFDLLKEIDREATLPEDLKERLGRGAAVTFSFSTINDAIAKRFEPGATQPSRRLEALKQAVGSGFHSGVSLMPLLPYITDTPEHLESMFRTFKEAGVKYIFPASITLFGNGPYDSMTLTMDAVRKYDEGLPEKYASLFKGGFQIDYNYRRELEKRTGELLRKYGLRSEI